ncbi:hypothetical protein [Luteipulveratus mongoliensis]|uniref:hypothetical protein n=1 Tax=Luteipulveratus mongoliensis TaxID=571913 RepID=UPI0006963B72|nr:hypothetical protein [Luteipulveratus mongoliensis]
MTLQDDTPIPGLMPTKKRSKRAKTAIGIATAGLLLLAGGTVASAVTSNGTANCTASPKAYQVEQGTRISVVCTIPGTAGGTSTVTQTVTHTVTASPTSSPTTTPAPDEWPDASNTGVPAGTLLTAYTGPNTITVNGTVIDGKTVTGDLDIEASNVIIKNSVVNGQIANYAEDFPDASFTITDSTVNVGNTSGTGIGHGPFTATRVEVTGGNRSIDCAWQCTVEDSWVHGQFTDPSGSFHESGIRVGAYSTITHNRIACDAPFVAPDGGCSAALTGYPDFAAVQHNKIDGNFFVANTYATPEGVFSMAFCAYFGDTPGKAYSGQTIDIDVTNNVWEKDGVGSHSNCGYYGPYVDFPEQDPDSTWINNTMTDHSVLLSNY